MSVVHFLFLLNSIPSFFIFISGIKWPTNNFILFHEVKKKKLPKLPTSCIFPYCRYCLSKIQIWLPSPILKSLQWLLPSTSKTVYILSMSRQGIHKGPCHPSSLISSSFTEHSANYLYWGAYGSPLSSITFMPLHSPTSQPELIFRSPTWDIS